MKLNYLKKLNNLLDQNILNCTRATFSLEISVVDNLNSPKKFVEILGVKHERIISHCSRKIVGT